MRYVGEKANESARMFEQRLACLSPEAGILFSSVEAQPTEDGESREFFVRIGIRRCLTDAAGRALINQVFEQEMQAGLKFYAGIYRGVSGACRDAGSAAARPTAS